MNDNKKLTKLENRISKLEKIILTLCGNIPIEITFLNKTQIRQLRKDLKSIGYESETD